MPSESLLVLAALALSVVLNAASIMVLRSTTAQLVSSVIAYRPGRGGAKKAMSGQDADDQAYSPLKDVFQQYSVLTARMADLVFRLTELRSHSPEEALVAARQLRTEVANAMTGLQHGVAGAMPAAVEPADARR
jgi:hypothetical protein